MRNRKSNNSTLLNSACAIVFILFVFLLAILSIFIAVFGKTTLFFSSFRLLLNVITFLQNLLSFIIKSPQLFTVEQTMITGKNTNLI